MKDLEVRRFRAPQFLGLSSAAVLVLAVVLYFWVHSVAERKWATLEKRISELRNVARARDTLRPVLRGEVLPGNAWEEYLPALREVGSREEDYRTLEAWVYRYTTGDKAAAEAIVQQHASLLDPIRRGVRHRDGQFPYDWNLRVKLVKGPEQKQACEVVFLGVCEARILVEAGRARDGAELLLDLCQFSHDVGDNGTMISLIVSHILYGIATEELKEVLLAARLSKEEWIEIARQLEILDRTFPSYATTFMNNLLETGLLFTTPEVEQKDLLPGATALAISGSWRYFFSWRLMLGKAWEEWDLWCSRAARASGGPWKQMLLLCEESQLAGTESPNPIIRIILPGSFLQYDRTAREELVHLRLLRVAALFRATGEVLELDDPFGTRLRHSRTGERLKVWSLGKDGVDDGGSGVWKNHKGKDIVLEVER